MISETLGRRIYTAVISSGRPENSFPLPATWHVPTGQEDLYASTGKPVGAGSDRGPAAARNAVLDAAAELEADAMIFDDDPTGLITFTYRQDLVTREMDPKQAAQIIVRSTVYDTRASLGSSGYHKNSYNVNVPVSTWGGGVMEWVTYVPFGPHSHLRQDESLSYAEGFDYALQHAVNGGGICRVNAIYWEFKMGDPGGISAGLSQEDKDIAYKTIVDRWSPLVEVSPSGGLSMKKSWMDPKKRKELFEVL